MARPRVYPDELRQRAVRLVREWQEARWVTEGGYTPISCGLTYAVRNGRRESAQSPHGPGGEAPLTPCRMQSDHRLVPVGVSEPIPLVCGERSANVKA